MNEGCDTRSVQHYLGHKNIAHTVRYTELAPDRFKRGHRGHRVRVALRTRRGGKSQFAGYAVVTGVVRNTISCVGAK